MLQFITKKLRHYRAREYLKVHPEDEAAVQPILFALDTLSAKSAREVAEMLAGRRFSDAEWLSISPRWERAWNAVRWGHR
jgi:hypothetical protein